jgi:2'-5' RNA ligase superfamily
MIDKFRHPWPADFAYFFYVVLDDKLVMRQVEKVQARFDFPGLVPVLRDELHITVLPVAFEGKVTDDQLREISADAARAVNEVSRERVTLGSVVVDDDQVVLLANPCQGLHRVRELLRQSLQNRLAHDAMSDDENFRPHVSMFYSIGEHPTEPVERLASAINSAGGKEIRTVIDTISLVRVHRALGHYGNVVVESFQLGKAARTIT